ncbi:uncharacterized protein LOC121028958 [Herpailurus yagouaroundi]|uniref:uncharacterized protein LOC121028958 n=1 Tax=Herpailurus yagouaroundi TaxID=1608482 RepID=UPI001AD6583D|nr:uncharacterized protein LOC121028958 [Puma yagouaroundi]
MAIEKLERTSLTQPTLVNSGLRQLPEGRLETLTGLSPGVCGQPGEEAEKVPADLGGGHACWPRAPAQAARHREPPPWGCGQKAAAAPTEEGPECPRPAPGQRSLLVSWKRLRKRSKRPSLCKARRCCKSSPRQRAKVPPPTQTAAPDLLLWCLFFSERKSTELVSRKPGRDLISCGEASARAPPGCVPSLPQALPPASPTLPLCPRPNPGPAWPFIWKPLRWPVSLSGSTGSDHARLRPCPPPPVWLDAAQPQEPSPPMGPLPWWFHPLGSLITPLRSQLEFPLLQTLFPSGRSPWRRCRRQVPSAQARRRGAHVSASRAPRLCPSPGRASETGHDAGYWARDSMLWIWPPLLVNTLLAKATSVPLGTASSGPLCNPAWGPGGAWPPAETRLAKLRSRAPLPPQPTALQQSAATSPPPHQPPRLTPSGGWSPRKTPKAQRSRGRGLDFRDAQGLLPGAMRAHPCLRMQIDSRLVQSSCLG